MVSFCAADVNGTRQVRDGSSAVLPARGVTCIRQERPSAIKPVLDRLIASVAAKPEVLLAAPCRLRRRTSGHPRRRHHRRRRRRRQPIASPAAPERPEVAEAIAVA